MIQPRAGSAAGATVGELRPWLYRIVRNTALNDLRDRGGATEELAESLPGGRSAAAEVEAREELRELMARLQALPEPQRAALVMRELEGLSHEEIAAALGVSGGAARQAIFRARAALRDGLGLLVPMPVLRALAEHGGEVAGAGAAAGAIKVGLATVLVAGTVGAGVAIEHRHGERAGPEAAEAATLPRSAQQRTSLGAPPSHSPAITSDRHGGGASDDHGRNHGEGGDDDRSSLADGDRSGSDDGSHHSGGRSGSSGDDDDSGHGGSGSIDSSGPGSRHGEDGGDDDHSGSGSGSDDGFDDHSGSSGDSGSGGSSESGDDGASSGPGSGEETVSEPVPTTEPVIEDGGDSSGSGSGGESSGSGSDDDSVILDAPSG